MPSQNVTFDGAAPDLGDPAFAEPEGASIVLAVRDFIRPLGWEVGELDIFYGAWGLFVQRASGRLQMVVTGPLTEGAGDWFLQIGYESPGLLSRLFGKVAPATPEDCFSLALHVNDCLRLQGFTNLRWREDGPPTAAESSPEPSRSS